MKKETNQARTLRDAAVLLILIWAFAQAILLTFADSTNRMTYLLVIFLMDAATMIGFMGRTAASVTLAGTLTSAWVAYKLYDFYSGGATFAALDYVITPLPLIGAAVAAMFNNGMSGINTENKMLRKQVEELVLVDDVTGLYNLRALYRDIQVMIRYGERNKLPISLMIVEMRYEGELRGMLPHGRYIELRRRIAEAIQGCVRIEDRVYAISETGETALLLTTNEKNSSIVRARIVDAVSAPDAFAGILERGTHVELRIACKEYQDVYDGNMMKFKKQVESELVYDV